MEKYLIAIDLDGTLRHDDGHISEYSINTIKKLKEKGHIVVTATARPHNHALQVNNDVFKSDYLVCSSGSEVFDIKNDYMINEEFIKYMDVMKLYKYAKKYDLNISFTIGKHEYITKKRRDDTQIQLTDINVLKGNVKEVFVTDPNKLQVKKFISKVKHMNIVLQDFQTEEGFFIVLADNVNKGHGIKTLANYLNVDKIISFGNDENDIPMFEISHMGIAVSNATRDTLNKANKIIESNNEDAVAKYLCKTFSL